MSADLITEEVEQFLREHISSVPELELLLLLQKRAPTDSSAAELQSSQGVAGSLPMLSR